jgi:choline dehydrogenase-like flavoprotein
MHSVAHWFGLKLESWSLDPQRTRSLAVFIDVSALESGAVLRARVCVVGSGPAGMTTAVTLAKKGFDVILIEAGGRHLTGDSQAQFAGEVVGDRYYDLSFARLRMFGGTSNHWGGYCAPLDYHDFERHPRFPETGWPISRSDLDPYLEGACEVLEIPNRFEEELVTPTLRRIQFQFSPPVNFGQKYDEFCRSSDRLRVCLNSVLTDLRLEDHAIKSAVVATDGPEFSVDAECFVLCAGGIENSRLLLWINQRSGGRLVQDSRTLGRYWMEHPHANLGDFLLEGGPEFFDDGRAFFALTKQAQYHLGVLNAGVRVVEQAYSTTKGLIADLLCYAPALGERLMGLLDKELVCGARIRSSHWEQEPRFENHVALDSTKSDGLGIPRVKLHWKKSEADRRTIVLTANEFARQIANSELGRVRLMEWLVDDDVPMTPQKTMGAWHHMGGTRMSDNPDQGIVDRNLRVHGNRNLYVGGSSVFRSGGYANPTLTIVQLSLRLSDEIERRLS